MDNQQRQKMHDEQVAASLVNRDSGGGQAMAMGPNLARRVPLREQLEKRTYGLAEQHERVTRALDILNRHPEFEEFLQLQELINSGLYY